MLNRLLKYITYGPLFCGIEHLTKNGEEKVSVSLLKLSKKELLIQNFYQDQSIENASQILPKNQHITLVLNNDKVLTKSLKSNQQDGLKLVYSAFPNIDIGEFYYEILSQTKGHHYIALCRKNYIEDLIQKYSELKVSVTSVSLGNALVGSISKYINKDAVYSSNARISIEHNRISQIEKENAAVAYYNVNGLRVINSQLLSFCGALQSYINTNDTKSNFSGRELSLKEDFKQSRFFNLFLKAGGVFILVLLLLNFLYFNHYFSKVSALKELSEVNQTTNNKILKLDEVVSKKQKIVDDLLKNNKSKSSFFANEIIHSLPNSIMLKAFNYQPLLKRVKHHKGIELNKNTITIEGSSNNSKAFSNWITALERKHWLSHIDILDYGSTSSNTSDFTIELILEDD